MNIVRYTIYTGPIVFYRRTVVESGMLGGERKPESMSALSLDIAR